MNGFKLEPGFDTDGRMVEVSVVRTPPRGGSGVTKDCVHDFAFLRTEMMKRAGESDIDVFFCRHCLEYREAKRK